MNRKQQLGYTFLGSAIMLIGLGVGTIVSPPLIAQRSGLNVGELECTSLTVVDENGRDAIILAPTNEGNGMIIYDRSGKKAILLVSGKDGNIINVYNEKGKNAITLSAVKGGRFIELFDKTGSNSISLVSSDKVGNKILVRNAGFETWQVP